MPTLQADSANNVAYGSDPQQVLDMWLPANRSSDTTKVMILIHGGGWIGGDKTDLTAAAGNTFGFFQFVYPGYAFFNINYRLATATTNQFPAQEDDVNAAVQYIYNHRSQYHISDKFVIQGFSAGGHLALLQAYKYTSPVKIEAVGAYYAITDLVALYNNPPSFTTFYALNTAIGASPATDPQIYQQSSPINFVNAQTCPTIIFQGGTDTLVSPQQAFSLDSVLISKNVSQQLVYFPADGHGLEL